VVAVNRVLDWFWLTSAERMVRASDSGPSARLLELSAYASLAFEAAQRTARPTEPFSTDGADALACELFREAIHAALVAHLERETSSPEAALPDLATALERVDATISARIPGATAELTALKAELGSGSYLAFAALPKADQKKLVLRLEALGELLLTPLAGQRLALERIWARRVLHVFGLLVLLGGVAFGAHAYGEWREQKGDLAPKATWVASSDFGVGGCKSPQQQCDTGPNYFFHTAQDADPAITFDLGKVRQVSGVEIDNRRDCCQERADPLVVDVSTNGATWKVVARRTGSFTTWRAPFSPVRARYVKIHVPVASGALHLSRVRIIP
jgi:hypothetical protein